MHALRHARAARLTVALAASFALLLALPTTAHAAEPVAPPAPRTTAPAAVLASISPGGQAYRTAAHYILDAPDSETAVAQGLTLGTPHARLYYEDADRSSSVLGGEELVSPSGAVEWISLAEMAGEPIEEFTVGDDGRLISSGGGSPESERALASLPAGALLLEAGPPASPARYLVSDDRRTLTPFDDQARAASGSSPLTVAAFRANQRAVHAHWLATSPGLPEEPEQGTNVAVMLSILGAAAVGTIIWGVLTRRRRHVTPHPAT
ncbi:MAG TPA: hypothetical protein VNR17_14175 [Luteimicrobium sp.]|nr:hypothetical protein [Luteimicrobium sp.]